MIMVIIEHHKTPGTKANKLGNNPISLGLVNPRNETSFGVPKPQKTMFFALVHGVQREPSQPATNNGINKPPYTNLLQFTSNQIILLHNLIPNSPFIFHLLLQTELFSIELRSFQSKLLSQLSLTYFLSHTYPMASLYSLTISTFFIFSILFTTTYAATFDIHNNCPYTVWAAAVPGGGSQLNNGQTWTIQVPAGRTGGRVWARTNCNFDGSGHGSCQTGDCGGLLQCQNYGTPPNTLAEFALNQYQNLDFIDISLVDGFNVPMDFSPTGGCSRGIRCSADINGQCPSQLRAPGGCNNPCTVYKTDQYCCNSGSCGPTDLSRFFKGLCPDAYSYPKDDQTSTFTCPGGTNYRVTFCP